MHVTYNPEYGYLHTEDMMFGQSKYYGMNFDEKCHTPFIYLYRKPLRIGAAVNTKPYNYRNAANPSHFM
ncbi:hypothetical protein BpHYR1_014378 [Brachionus plicatilis]|uniref:Uncharacterized protein n=1 Tax=Brachionus plicatilis TaxID=10195 RepID=A0A3M7RLV6_BRAPC|nr:hypothetical protein BpHYR1_014378 [Brachionus plicatilis]